MRPLGLTGGFFADVTVENWSRAREEGFEHMEVIFSRSYPFAQMIEKARAMYDVAVASGIKPASAHLPFGFPWDPSTANIGHLKKLRGQVMQLIETVAEWQIPIAVLHASYEVIDPEERESRLATARDSIAIFGEHAKRLGVTLAVENLPRTALGRTAEEILYLTDNGRLASMCFDFNHLLIETHAEFLKKCGHLAVTTHISDYDRVDEKHWLPGEGCIDFRSVVDCLDALGYQGQMLFETKQTRALPGSVVDSGVLYERWQQLMQR